MSRYFGQARYPLKSRFPREDVHLGAIHLVKHIAFAFIGRQYDPVPRRLVVRTGVPLGIQQRPVVQPHNVRRREVWKTVPPEKPPSSALVRVGQKANTKNPNVS
jgi:hypothetical protein